ncbi:hypothetical protein [Paenibacillus sp. MBLB4367]|uniref:hypothetical protein n=1 Tax=Paenibacillus sp. MBLB4367 TaxID=3384767 RepID=UPI0039084432
MEEKWLMRELEKKWKEIESYQVRQSGSHWRGAFEIPDSAYKGMYVQIETGLQMTVPLYSHPESKWYRSGALLEVIEEQIDYLLRSQYPSGCISLINCNIDSPPDTGFAVHIASLSYHALASVDAPEAHAVSGKLKQFLYGTIPCLLKGGIHTPNHRWVICGALALLSEIFPDERLRERADAYFAEGLDINKSGEWTERSNAVYNAVCCNFLYHAARVFQYEDLIAPIASNLEMMKYMLHPDGAIVTEYSSRHDRGKTFYLSDEYYIAFTLMASHTKSNMFRTLADEALKYATNPGLPLLYWMRFPNEMKGAGERSPLPLSYDVLLNEGSQAAVSGSMPYVRTSFHSGSPLVRYRHEDLSVTLVSGQPEFLCIQFGKARMVGLRWSLGWFGIAGVPMAKLEKRSEGCYEMSIQVEGAYFGPVEGAGIGRTGRSAFDFNFEGREKTHISKLEMRVGIALRPDGLTVKLKAEQMPNLFAQTVFSFAPGGVIESDGCSRLADHLYLHSAGSFVYRYGDDRIEIVGGADEHRYVCLRNDDIDPQLLNVISNFTTPMTAELHIHCYRDTKGENVQ